MSRDQRPQPSDQHLALAMQLCGLALAPGSHVMALQALLAAFASIAVAHPCCTAQAALTTEEMAKKLHLIASVSQQPPSQHVH